MMFNETICFVAVGINNTLFDTIIIGLFVVEGGEYAQLTMSLNMHILYEYLYMH